MAYRTMTPTEEHRAMVRRQLRALLEQGINPLNFFDRHVSSQGCCHGA